MTALHLAPGAALPLRFLTRHALITGATGTGKTVTLATLVEGMAGAGVPVLALDAKGDLESLGHVLCPFGDRGDRAPLDLYRMGPEIMARALDLSEAQAGALYVLHAFAEADGWPLATVEDLRAICAHAAANHREISARFGLVSPASLAAVQRGLFRLDPGAYGRPGLDVAGRSGVTIYAAAKLARKPEQYAAAVTWLLLDLYERSPELGNCERPSLAVVIDEAHLIFEGIPPSLEKRLASVARLIRSKGVALIWATQSPGDLPAVIMGQCLTRIQHGLRAATPAQLRDVRAAAESLPGGFDVAGTILELGVGEALVSLPDATGTPQTCQRVRITPGRITPRPGPVRFHPTAALPASGVAQGWPTPINRTGPLDISPPVAQINRASPLDISPPPRRRPWPWWRYPLTFIAWTGGLVGVASFFG